MHRFLTWLLSFACLLPATPVEAKHSSKPGVQARQTRSRSKGHPDRAIPEGKPGRCTVRYDRARFRDTHERFAGRNHISVETFRRLNGLQLGSLLVHQREYISARGMAGEHLVDGETLGDSTSDFIVIHPDRAWGQRFVVDLLRKAASRVQSRYPDGHRIVFEDLSFQHGGCMKPHREHRGGLEVDAGLYHRGIPAPKRLVRAHVVNFDAKRTWLFLHSLIATGMVKRVILDKQVQVLLWREARRQGWSAAKLASWLQYPGGHLNAVIHHGGGHDNHAHIKFRCDPGTCAVTPDADLPDVDTPDGQPLPDEP